MKQMVVLAGCLALFYAGWCYGQGQTAKGLPGGTTWKGVTGSERQMYVVGFMHGYVLGGRDTAAILVAKLEKGELSLPKLRPTTPAQKKDMDEGIEEAEKAAPTIGRTSALILEAAMSTFYNDQRNATVCWDKAAMLSAASLAGNAPTDQELDAARMKGAESGCH
ncbi:MAG TPA: hypothetical protein VE994_21630 [Terriglobales bacterium]|nr:hypothetical protein [Terriglobales bacterium]